WPAIAPALADALAAALPAMSKLAGTTAVAARIVAARRAVVSIVPLFLIRGEGQPDQLYSG
ncbi:MAG TPA: hypothetical protein DEH11_12730, partial [Actinobacteria bacterium]|nr:hypothetical protein [Actinomycetota bacterium]